MSIEIKMRDDKWRVIITEEWEVPNEVTLKKLITDLIDKKEMYGKLKDFKTRQQHGHF